MEMKMIASLLGLIIASVAALPTHDSSKVCTQFESVKPGKDCHMPKDNVTKPLFPKEFTVQAPGFLAVPPGPNATFRIKVNTSRLAHYYSWTKNTLKYDGDFDIFGPIKLPYNFTHVGDVIYNQLVIPQVCVCNHITVGIFKYDAFMDAKYMGRETIDVEFGVGKVLTDHYVKDPGHNLWMEVETGLPIRFFQEGMGLQVYMGWKQATPSASILTPPAECFDVGGCKSSSSAQKDPKDGFAQSPLENMAVLFYQHMKEKLDMTTLKMLERMQNHSTS